MNSARCPLDNTGSDAKFSDDRLQRTIKQTAGTDWIYESETTARHAQVPLPDHPSGKPSWAHQLSKRRFIPWKTADCRGREDTATDRIDASAWRQTASEHCSAGGRAAVPARVPCGERHALCRKPRRWQGGHAASNSSDRLTTHLAFERDCLVCW